jgi:threonine aldolase
VKRSRGFASDNNAGVHPEVFQALAEVNQGHAAAYGDDRYTAEAGEAFRRCFGDGIEVFFVYGGTAANVLSLASMTRSFNAVLCSSAAHLHVDECGAAEKSIGCKLIPMPTADGKIRAGQIDEFLDGAGDQHHVQVAAISLTQSTEYGTVYTPAELKAVTDRAHQRNLLVHVDGARIANAAAGLKVDLSTITRDAGIDVLSFGGTKNGMMYGEAVVFFNTELARNFRYIRKQNMQLASKMRFVAAQFTALLSKDLWRRNAEHSNNMARLLAEQLRRISAVTVTQKVESNAVFAILPEEAIGPLQEEYSFYVWNQRMNEVRLMASFDTTPADVEGFVAALELILRDRV